MVETTKKKWGGPRPGSGRKPLPKGQRRDRKVMVTLTEAEHADASEAAGEKPLGTYIRELLLRHLARRKK